MCLQGERDKITHSILHCLVSFMPERVVRRICNIGKSFYVPTYFGRLSAGLKCQNWCMLTNKKKLTSLFHLHFPTLTTFSIKHTYSAFWLTSSSFSPHTPLKEGLKKFRDSICSSSECKPSERLQCLWEGGQPLGLWLGPWLSQSRKFLVEAWTHWATLSLLQAWKAHLMGREGCKQNSRRTAVSQRTQPAQGKAFILLLIAPTSPTCSVRAVESVWAYW